MTKIWALVALILEEHVIQKKTNSKPTLINQ